MRRFATLFQEYTFLDSFRSLRGKTEERFILNHACRLNFSLQAWFNINLSSVFPRRDLKLSKNVYSWNKVANLLMVE